MTAVADVVLHNLSSPPNVQILFALDEQIFHIFLSSLVLPISIIEHAQCCHGIQLPHKVH